MMLLIVPAGLIHSVGQNSKILEIQQPSDITYRFYDFNRLENKKLRPLHIEKSLQCLKNHNYQPTFISKNPLSYQFLNYVVKILKEDTILKNDAIVVDLIKEEAYLATKNEKINFKKYALIQTK